MSISTETPPNPVTFTLKALSVVEVPDEARSYLKIAGGVGSARRTEWLPLAYLSQPGRFAEFIANRFGYVCTKHEREEWIAKLTRAMQRLPRIVGTSRLGWTPDGQTFLYGTRTLPASAAVEFIAPEGTVWSAAAEAVTPRGDREEQYRAFRELWEQSPHFRLVLSLACVSLFLEVIGAPSLVFHLAGPSGIGKTTLLRLGLSAFADPFSSATCVDFSKDSKNYADAQLGVLHNFPILLDETTLRNAEDIAEAAYSIAVGHTKARLSGPERLYQPVKPMTYALVCLLSGESSIRDKIEHRGAAARFVELPVTESLLPEIRLPGWNRFVREHHGWLGLDLLTAYADPARRDRLAKSYQVGRALTEQWCKDHPRMVDFLALLQLGYRLAASRLGLDDSDAAAHDFAQSVYAQLNRRTKLDDVLDTIRARPALGPWIERGVLPIPLVRDACGMALGDGESLKGQLLAAKLITKADSRRVLLPGWLEPRSVKCYILTNEGKARLLPPTTTGRLGSGVTGMCP